MGIESGKIKIVVNRFVKKGWDIDPQEVERALGLKISWLIPNDFKTAHRRDQLRRAVRRQQPTDRNQHVHRRVRPHADGQADRHGGVRLA